MTAFISIIHIIIIINMVNIKLLWILLINDLFWLGDNQIEIVLNQIDIFGLFILICTV